MSKQGEISYYMLTKRIQQKTWLHYVEQRKVAYVPKMRLREDLSQNPIDKAIRHLRILFNWAL